MTSGGEARVVEILGERYQLDETLGQGGMATVYKARDTLLGRAVAIKVLRIDQFPPALLGGLRKRFSREARLLARLDHPHIVPIYDYGEWEGAPFLVMGYMPGGSLKAMLEKQGPLTWENAVRLLLPVIEALTYAHAQGVVHRDIKPSNILFDKWNRPRLADFGVAKIVMGEDKDLNATLTETGAAIGTPHYMAPEQWEGELSPAIDVYAMGVVLFEMMTGERPYEGKTGGEIYRKQLTQPLPLRKLQAPFYFRAVLQKALARDVTQRFPDMSAMQAALEKALQQELLEEPASPEDFDDEPPGDALEDDLATTLLPVRQTHSHAVAPEVVTVLSHGGQEVYQVAFSPASRLLASVAHDNVVRLWRLTSETVVWKQAPHRSPSRCVAFATDARPMMLVSAAEDGVVRMWEIMFGFLRTLKVHTSWWRECTSSQKLLSLAIAPRGGLVAVGTEEGQVRLCRGDVGKLMQILEAHTDWVNSLAFSPSGRLLASGGDDGFVRVWRAGSGGEVVSWKHEEMVSCVAFSPGEALLASGGWDGTVRLWRVTENEPSHVLPHGEWVSSIGFSPDGRLLASAADDGTVRLWDAIDGQLLQTWAYKGEGVHTVAFSPDGDLLAVASTAGDVALWSVELSG